MVEPEQCEIDHEREYDFVCVRQLNDRSQLKSTGGGERWILLDSADKKMESRSRAEQ